MMFIGKRLLSLILLFSLSAYADSFHERALQLGSVQFDESMEFARRHSHKKNHPIVNLCRSLYEKNNLSLVKQERDSLIPKRVHLIWLGSNTPPAIYKECRESIEKHLPGWEVTLWTDADVPALELYNQKFYDEEVNYAAKSDILRYEILYRFGGVYMDVDMVLNQNLDILHHSYEFYAGMEASDNAAIIGNAIIGSIPGHPILLEAILQIEDRRDDIASLEDWTLVKRTGPFHFQQSFFTAAQECDNGRIIIFPKSFFYPISFHDRLLTRSEQQKFIKPETFTTHFWAGSWLGATALDYAASCIDLIRQQPHALSNNDNNNLASALTSPPDATIDAGPQSLIAVVNDLIGFYSKDTVQQFYISGLLPFFGNNVINSITDPQVVFDEFSQRFFVLAFSPAKNFSRVFLSVSKSSNPQSREDFSHYFYDVPVLPDFPKMAVDNDAVYITTRDFAEQGKENFLGDTITVFNKTSLIEGISSPIVPIFKKTFLVPDTGAEQLRFICPMRPRVSSGGVNQVLLIQGIDSTSTNGVWTCNTLRVLQVKDVLTNPHVVSTDVTVPVITGPDGDFTVPQPAPQSNPFNNQIIGLDLTCMISNGVVSNNSLWTCQHAFSDDGTKRIVTRWYEIDVSEFLTKNKATLLQAGTMDQGGTTNQIYPSINVSKDKNMMIQATLVGANNYPAIAYTGRISTDTTNTVRLPLQTAIGGDLYYQLIFGGDAQEGAVNRYGDYSGLALDPDDNKTFWLFNQYPVKVGVDNDFPFGSDWGTFIGALQFNENCKAV